MNSPNIQNDFVTIKQEKAAQFEPVGLDFIEKKNWKNFVEIWYFSNFIHSTLNLNFFYKKKQIPFKFWEF